ncbi:MAG: hemerythrin domain-containing protein [Conexivisphaerales archaeon]
MVEKSLVDDHILVNNLLSTALEDIDKLDIKLIKDHLLKHIYFEEEVLFKLFENKHYNEIRGLEMEHLAIIHLLDKIAIYFSKGNRELAIKRIEGLKRVLEGHNSIEEQGIYKELNELSDDKQIELKLKFENAKVPSDWVCSASKAQKRYTA